MKPGLTARMAAARLLAAVIDRRTPLDGLTDARGGHPQFLALDERDRLLVRSILMTALRFRGTIEALIAARLDRPLPANATALSHILHVAAAQMLFLDVPESAAVDLAVEHAAGDPRTKRFAPLVNGVLREIGRRKERALPAALASAVDAPDWLREMLVAAYGEDRAGAILAAHRHEPAIDFTVRADPELWAEQLGGIVLPTGSVRVPRLAAPVRELPGYADGAWWVQDAAAALPARLLGDLAGRRVADLCAAPGGKTAQLAAQGAQVTAVEKVATRAARLRENLARLKLEAEIVETDLFEFAPTEPFDMVLLDAPCSSTGTIRRHPDVAWTKTPQDIAKLAALQKRMLSHAIGLLAPGGAILFSNCSLDPREGEHLVEELLAEDSRITLDQIDPRELPGIAPFVTREGWLRTAPDGLPHEDLRLGGLDGFFAARLHRRA